MTLATFLLVWEIVVDVGVAGLSLVYVTKKMKSNAKRKGDRYVR